jgi:predicted RNase H-like nuclease (RuvC/YqgF family)
MNKEELIKLSRENLRKSKQGSLCECYDEAFIKGYELSEKRIKELQEENKVLAQNLEDTEILNKTYEKRFEDLEKENAKLKTDYEVLSCSVGDFEELQDKLEEEQRKNNGLSDNLTKAKEIIRTLLLVADNKVSQMEFQLCVADAKQFISEVEK